MVSDGEKEDCEDEAMEADEEEQGEGDDNAAEKVLDLLYQVYIKMTFVFYHFFKSVLVFSGK